MSRRNTIRTATSARPRITRRTASLVMGAILLAVSVVQPAPAQAWGYFDGYGAYPQNPIKVCLEGGGFYGHGDDQALIAAVQHWDSRALNKTFQMSCSGPTIRVKTIDFSGWPNFMPDAPARAQQRSMGAWGLEGIIYVNTDYQSTFWMNSAAHACNVPCATQPVDYYTAISHEIGHSLGFSHNKNYADPDGDGPRTDGQCVGGYPMGTGAGSACVDDFYSVDIMYENAGDGYRRFITTDSLRGLDTLGYR